MPFFISQKSINAEIAKAREEAFESGKRTGRWLESAGAAIKTSGGFVQSSGSAIKDTQFNALVRLVPAVEQYASVCIGGALYLDSDKLAADIADLDAFEATDRGRAIKIRLEKSTSDFAKAHKDKEPTDGR